MTEKMKAEIERRELFNQRDIAQVAQLINSEPRAATAKREHFCDHRGDVTPLAYIAMLRSDATALGHAAVFGITDVVDALAPPSRWGSAGASRARSVRVLSLGLPAGGPGRPARSHRRPSRGFTCGCLRRTFKLHWCAVGRGKPFRRR